jgi:hypothetical protein
METPEKWPAYRTGPRDSIFAIGMVSIKFAELESTLKFIFGTAFGLDLNATTIVASKIGNEACVDLIERRLSANEWGNDINEHVLYFLEAFGKCLENRNHLVHSNLAWVSGEQHTVLFKTSKQGRTLGAVPKLTELRQVADDMHAYSEYGNALGGHINYIHWPPSAAFQISGLTASVFPLPDKPSPPHSLHYSSGPQALR